MKGRKAAEAALVFNTIIWGSTFVLVKAALDDVSPLMFLAVRFSLATVVLLAGFHHAKPFRDISWKALGVGALIGTFLFAGYALQTIGLRFTTPPKSAFITGLNSVLVPLIAALVYRIRPQVSEVAGLIVATAGLGLMTLEHGVGPVGRGDALTFFCAIGFAAHIVTLGHFSEQMKFELLSVAQVGTSAVWALSLFWWAETPHLVWRPAVLWAILITGIFATAVAFSIQAWAQRYTTPSRTALIYTLEPLFAWLTSFVLMGEGLSGRAAAGAVLIMGGVILVELKPWNARQHPSKQQMRRET